MLKQALTQSKLMRNPDFEKPFLLQTDASNVGIGAVLRQLDESGHDRPIAFFSKKLLDRDTKYAVVEKECLAIYLAVWATSSGDLSLYRLTTEH